MLNHPMHAPGELSEALGRQLRVQEKGVHDIMFTDVIDLSTR